MLLDKNKDFDFGIGVVHESFGQSESIKETEGVSVCDYFPCVVLQLNYTLFLLLTKIINFTFPVEHY